MFRILSHSLKGPITTYNTSEQRRPSDGGNHAFVEQLARACSASGAFEPAKRTYSAGGSFTGEPGALSAFGELAGPPAPPQAYTMAFPRCDVCAVRSNSAINSASDKDAGPARTSRSRGRSVPA